jgi:hypothetical protein
MNSHLRPQKENLLMVGMMAFEVCTVPCRFLWRVSHPEAFFAVASKIHRATGWTVGVRFPVGARYLSSYSVEDRLWGSPSLLSSGYQWYCSYYLYSPACLHGIALN